LAAKLSEKKAENMTKQSMKSFLKAPWTLRHTLIVDNGKELPNFKELKSKTGLKVYFSDPYAAWD